MEIWKMFLKFCPMLINLKTLEQKSKTVKPLFGAFGFKQTKKTEKLQVCYIIYRKLVWLKINSNHVNSWGAN